MTETSNDRGLPTSVLVLVTRPSVTGETSASTVSDLGFELADPAVPHISVLDLGVTRGDGIFEGIGCRSGKPQALEAHLTRLAASARALDLPEPDRDVWREATLAVCDALAHLPEASIKAVYTRGIEGAPADTAATGWVYGQETPDFTDARTTGVRVVTLDRGYRHDVASTSPWLLQGAKTLSYAINRAAIREAHRRDADDVIFISSEGIVLEGPTSSVVLRRGDRLLTPGTGLAILEGTTQGSVFAFAAERGMDTGFELSTIEQLHEADALWLVSSSRHAAPIRELDGVAIPVDTELSREMNEFLGSIEV